MYCICYFAVIALNFQMDFKGDDVVFSSTEADWDFLSTRTYAPVNVTSNVLTIYNSPFYVGLDGTRRCSRCSLWTTNGCGFCHDVYVDAIIVTPNCWKTHVQPKLCRGRPLCISCQDYLLYCPACLSKLGDEFIITEYCDTCASNFADE